MAGLGFGTIGLGALDTVAGGIGLLSSNTPNYQEYKPSKEILGAYNSAHGQAMNPTGYTPEETAAFNASMGRGENASYRRGIEMAGGNFGKAISTGIQANNIGARNSFVADDARMKEQNRRYYSGISDQLAKYMQELDNRNVSENNQAMAQEYGNQQKFFGGALNSGLSQIGSYFNQQGLFNFYDQLYGNKTGGAGAVAGGAAGATGGGAAGNGVFGADQYNNPSPLQIPNEQGFPEPAYTDPYGYPVRKRNPYVNAR